MVPPRIEIRRYTVNHPDAAYTSIHPAPIRHATIMQARDEFPSWDNMSLLEREASRDDH